METFRCKEHELTMQPQDTLLVKVAAGLVVQRGRKSVARFCICAKVGD